MSKSIWNLFHRYFLLTPSIYSIIRLTKVFNSAVLRTSPDPTIGLYSKLLENLKQVKNNVFWRFDGLFTSIIGPKRCTFVRLQDALGSLFLIISCFPIYMILCCKKKNCCRKIFYYDFRLARLIRKDSLWPLLRDLADSRLRRHLNLILFRIILCHLLWV